MNLAKQQENQSNLLDKIISPIKSSLDQMESRFKEYVVSENPVIQEMIDYVFAKKGKRLRPALVFISANINQDSKSQNIIDLALCIELIHIATLVHDDVNDKSDLRRGIETYNKKWGSTASVLFGDFLFARAFVILSQLGNLTIIQNLSKTTSEICEGEIMQNFLKTDYEITIDQYSQIIRYKTASLIAESCRIGAIITDQSVKVQDALYRFGLNLGMAFQIYDDYLDFKGDQSKLGKPVLNDIMNGYITLPMIHLFNQFSNGDREKVYKLIEEDRKANNLDHIKSLLKEYQCLEYSLNMANDYIYKAIDILDDMENDELRQSLRQVANFIIQRDY